MGLFTKTYLDFYTGHQHLIDLVPPARAKTPDWVSHLKSPKVYCQHTGRERSVSGSTIKTCPGFRDMFVNSFVIPAWTDIEIITDPAKNVASWYFGDSFTQIQQHDDWQVDSSFSDKYYVLKLQSPWYASTNTDISFVAAPAVWHWDKVTGDMDIPSGVFNFFRYRSGAVNVFLFIPKHRAQNILIPAGTPLIYLTPMTERKITLRITNKSHEPHSKLFFSRDYYKRLKLLMRREP